MRGADIIRQVEDTILERKLFEEGERIVAAVSGGPDSVALLHLLHRLAGRWRWTLSVAHVNHGLRGQESDEEEQFVKDLAARLGLPFWSARLNVKEVTAEHGNNVQAAARALRYEALRKAAEALQTTTVALGHHADDQAETVLMRIVRGTGPGGLAGIRFVRHAYGMKLVRPLLRITKSELEFYCELFGLQFRRDSSNESRKYFRNVVRLDLLPYLMKHRDGVREALSRLAQISADESDLLDAEAEALVRSLTEKTDRGVKGDRIGIANVHPALQRRMFKIILSCLAADDSSIDFSKLERMREAIVASSPSNMELRLTDKLYFRRIYDAVEWTTREKPEAPSYVRQIDVTKNGGLHVPEANASLEWMLAEPSDPDEVYGNDSCVALFDADRLGGELLVRNRRPGDRIEPYGLKGSKKVKDMFIDLKIAPERRDKWPLIATPDGTLLWVPGLRRSRHALVDERSGKIVRIRFSGDFFA
ncbi:tRNA lysidine(34) synthetase TilS [Paenibacillus alkalitolerans]|uniref:tRNA lysidine(34) synthetase TilS n=1 Tax=Paenibacillus alkalitolerans TaxID=2799335 RepID=UPI0018F733C0|nr:tRNA lysidine(34) synthetase TilS [Paenibacillus alkalitolerans]